ncbi:MAG: hypothetical protein LBD11_02855 [Candidatus Peribacteria bacterium]|jgi:hypothetical protein|nr:hypothetical protein [Candidatus Peribacteria bacterium]
MKINLILPKNGVEPDFSNGERLYFLAGPIRGGGDWQKRAVALLGEKDPGCYIASPSPNGYMKEHELLEWGLPTNNPALAYSFTRQTLWERYYLQLALENGALIFWLPVEDANIPREKKDGPYARDTYGEIGRWSIYALLEGTYPIIGAEKEFSGLDQIHVNLREDVGKFLGQSFGKSFPIYDSLEKTLDEAVMYARVRKEYHKAYDPEKDPYPYSAYLRGDYSRQNGL